MLFPSFGSSRRVNFMCRRFGTLFHLHRPCGQEESIFLSTRPMKMEHSVPKRRHIKFRRRESHKRKNTITNTEILEARNSVIYTAIPSEVIILHEQLNGVFLRSQHRGYDRQICHVAIRYMTICWNEENRSCARRQCGVSHTKTSCSLQNRYSNIYLLVSTSKASHVQYWNGYVDVTQQLHLTGYIETVAYIRVYLKTSWGVGEEYCLSWFDAVQYDRCIPACQTGRRQMSKNYKPCTLYVIGWFI